MTQPIPYHGNGVPVAQLNRPDRLSEDAPSIELTPTLAGDMELLATGAFSPLRGFMGHADYTSVVSQMRLANGVLWPIPVVFPVDDRVRPQVSTAGRVQIVTSGIVVGEVTVEEIFRRDKDTECRLVYGTTNSKHPSVARVQQEPDYLIGGPLTAWLPSAHPTGWVKRPAETRSVFLERGWRRIVGFQTRNPIHRAHEHLVRLALEMADAVLIHPLIGATKEDDIPNQVRWMCYEALVNGYLPARRTMLSGMPGAMRYAGPREAVLHMIVRQNYGCTRFIVGRDHAGVGGFYEPLAAQHLAAAVAERGDVAIEPLFFDETFWCRRCDQLASQRTCDHPPGDRVVFSGSWIREQLQTGGDIPRECSRPEVVEILRDQVVGASHARPKIRPDRGGVIWMTGLSGAGKSTLSTLVHQGLVKRGLRTEVLDGDVVRLYLSKGLGFSREDRDENIRRIGYVAGTLAAHGVWAIVAAISPYRATRDEVRRSVQERGGEFLEIFVYCPLDVAEQRDPKGLYKRARAGEISQFTGVSDPYEPPLQPELTIDTTTESPEYCAAAILSL